MIKKIILNTLLIAFVAGAAPLLLAQKYNPAGRRDPFVSLLEPKDKKIPPQAVQAPPVVKRPPGLPGLLISEVTVVGTAANNNRKIAILSGSDKYTYMAREGSKLFDGFIEEINTEGVVFTRETIDTAGTKSSSRVTKRFYTEEAR